MTATAVLASGGLDSAALLAETASVRSGLSDLRRGWDGLGIRGEDFPGTIRCGPR